LIESTVDRAYVEDSAAYLAFPQHRTGIPTVIAIPASICFQAVVNATVSSAFSSELPGRYVPFAILMSMNPRIIAPAQPLIIRRTSLMDPNVG